MFLHAPPLARRGPKGPGLCSKGRMRGLGSPRTLASPTGDRGFSRRSWASLQDFSSHPHFGREVDETPVSIILSSVRGADGWQQNRQQTGSIDTA